jgi:hypothetical protein
MKAKQLIERNLPFSDVYVYLGITRGSIESGQLCTCDNCGKLITNMVTVASNTTGRKYTIGTDCTETLANAKALRNNINTDYRMDIYAYNQTARFVTELNAGATMENNGMFCTLINRKDKHMTIPTYQLKEYFPQYL